MKYKTKSKKLIHDVLPEKGLINIKELAEKMNCCITTVWHRLQELLATKIMRYKIGKNNYKYAMKKITEKTRQVIWKTMKRVYGLYNKFKKHSGISKKNINDERLVFRSAVEMLATST